MKRGYTKPASPDTWLRLQLHAANALVRFCDEHQYGGPSLERVRSCRNALEVSDIAAAVSAYRMVPLGGNGCFNDWQPSQLTDNDAFEYALAIFQALVERWSRLMSLSVAVYDA